MFKLAKVFFIICETPLHAGSGTDLGIVDMPVQREQHTGFPKIEASGLKGCIRDLFEELYTDTEKRIDVHKVFGYDSQETDEKVRESFENDEQFAGALGFTDARILLFPVKSMKGVFAWITCPMVLNRFSDELSIAGYAGFPRVNNITQALIVDVVSGITVKDGLIVLEEYKFNVASNRLCTDIADWLAKNAFPVGDEYEYIRGKIRRDFVILPDEEFRDFVTMSTETATRIKIDNKTGTVSGRNLFTVEYLPEETLMYSIVLTTPLFCKKQNEDKDEKWVMDFFDKGIKTRNVIQVGGDATTGKGLVTINLFRGDMI